MHHHLVGQNIEGDEGIRPTLDLGAARSLQRRHALRCVVSWVMRPAWPMSLSTALVVHAQQSQGRAGRIESLSLECT